jgi:structural maintenance of chromosome 2
MATKTAFESAKQSASLKNQEMGRCSREVKELERERESLSKEAQHASLEARKLTHKLQKWEKDARDLVQLVSSLEKQHPWISREKAFFGQEGSDFDFRGRDRDQCVRRHRELKVEQDRLAKKINKKVMGMIENAASEYEELTRKREVILNDKAKIEAVIEELDMKKSQALQNTWTKVNKDFGSIFAMLLPGVTAKLDPSEGCSVSEGLEVKVAFNGVWKDSLTELSGGQRSLLALSLILALLLFKPAPMYILDEVDAALDLSHTQNIGMMLRTHFSTSQFIVVSLKEGMFNNANVIFRTRFVDGVSAVTRTVANSKSKQLVSAALLSHTAPSVGHQEDEPADAPKKKKGKGVVSRVGSQEASDTAAAVPLDL